MEKVEVVGKPVGSKCKQTDFDFDNDAAPSRSKTPARLGTSKPASSQPRSRKQNKLEDFSEIAQAEETTRQKEMDLSHIQAQHSLACMQAKKELALAKLQDKKDQREQNAQEKEMKFQLQMERLKRSTDSGDASDNE
ncbi:hypothetical protein H0H92_006241 [Tricholoma furcatifolium]|nr:hypothetical protein H0H92_006241 [Tricholoma furcatifolium]